MMIKISLNMANLIANTSRTRDILLLLFLVPNCHLSMLTFWSGSLQHTVVDDDVEVALIYRGDGKAGDSLL